MSDIPHTLPRSNQASVSTPERPPQTSGSTTTTPRRTVKIAPQVLPAQSALHVAAPATAESSPASGASFSRKRKATPKDPGPHTRRRTDSKSASGGEGLTIDKLLCQEKIFVLGGQLVPEHRDRVAVEDADGQCVAADALYVELDAGLVTSSPGLSNPALYADQLGKSVAILMVASDRVGMLITSADDDIADEVQKATRMFNVGRDGKGFPTITLAFSNDNLIEDARHLSQLHSAARAAEENAVRVPKGAGEASKDSVIDRVVTRNTARAKRLAHELGITQVQEVGFGSLLLRRDGQITSFSDCPDCRVVG